MKLWIVLFSETKHDGGKMSRIVFVCLKCEKKCKEWTWWDDDCDSDYVYTETVYLLFDELRRQCTNPDNPVSLHEDNKIYIE